MASSFIDTFQNLANSFSSTTNSFTWDNAIRRFQYAIAGITLGALAIFESTNKMQCSVKSQAFPEYYFASSYCYESTWYVVSNMTNTTTTKTATSYDDKMRYFKWYILIPPLMTIIISVLYGAIVNGFLVQALRSASKIMNMGNAKIEDSATIEGTSAINNTILNMAIRARIFSETNMHYRKCTLISCCTRSRASKKCSPSAYGATEDGDNTELFRIDQISQNLEEIMFVSPTDRLGHNTYMYYHIYLILCLAINAVAVAFINPNFFWFPNVIACRYQTSDLIFHWSICSVPGYRYFRVAVVIVMLNHAVGILVALLSLFYANVVIPNEILKANVAISSYTRNPKQQEKLHQCWAKKGKAHVKNLTFTTRFVLALIYQNIDRTLCHRLVLAMVDILKDRDAIDSDLPRLTKEIVKIDMEHPGVINEDKEEIINEIRETILNPVGIDQVKGNIQDNILVDLVYPYLDNPDAISKLFQAQEVHRITGVQLPKLSRDVTNKFISLIQERKESDFENVVTYSRFLSAVYDLSKVKQFFSFLQPTEIGQLHGSESETIDFISDNGHDVVAGQHFDGRKAFDASGYCWRSSDATAYNWIKRTWDREYTIKLIAIQGSHVNRKSTPIRFNFEAKLEKGGEAEWATVSETYRTYDWLNDEWRVFPVITTDKVDGTPIHPRTKCFKINIFENGGAEFFEIQKIRIYGFN